MEPARPAAEGARARLRRLAEPARWLFVAAGAAVSLACVRDTFATPFSGSQRFVPWISEAWRSAYPWAVAAAALHEARRRRAGGASDWRDAHVAGALAFPAAYAAAPPLFRGLQALLPAAVRDDVAIAAVWLGIALEGWLPPIVLAGTLAMAIGHVARRAGGGWPTRGVGA